MNVFNLTKEKKQNRGGQDNLSGLSSQAYVRRASWRGQRAPDPGGSAVAAHTSHLTAAACSVTTRQACWAPLTSVTSTLKAKTTFPLHRLYLTSRVTPRPLKTVSSLLKNKYFSSYHSLLFL